MRPWRNFLISLAAMLVLYLAYGVVRFRLGVDLTDEGAYLSWPLRLLYGEPAFTSEIMTITRPLEVYLYRILPFGPALGVYGMRLLGWSIHLAAFAVFAGTLFLRGAPAWRALFVASVPCFAVHLFGLAPPAYNMMGSDFLMIALSLRAAAAWPGGPKPDLPSLLAGLALFVATVSHPGLGLVAAVALVWELGPGQLWQNGSGRRLSPSNRGMLAFVVCWVVLLMVLGATGGLRHWAERLAAIQAITASVARQSPAGFVGRLLAYLPTYHWAARTLALGGTLLVLGRWWSVRRRRPELERKFTVLLALLVGGTLFALLLAPRAEPSTAFALLTFLLVLWRLPFFFSAADARVPGMLTALSLLAGLVYGTATYYFTPLRSWQSGLLGLPFALGVGLEALVAETSRRVPGSERLSAAVMFALIVLVARGHYGLIYRDAAPGELTAGFRIPALRGIRSTPERVASLDALYDYLHPRLPAGSPLLVFDDGPLLYYLFEARPVYAATWAVRYSLPLPLLERFDRELRAKPLPDYAVRLMVDPSYPVWATAARTRFDNYPLNRTLENAYKLERTVFPFEVWKRKPESQGTPAEGTAAGEPARH